MSKQPDFRDIAYEFFRDYMALYSVLYSGVDSIKRIIACIDETMKYANSCIGGNYRPCAAATLEVLEPCFYRHLGDLMSTIGIRYEAGAVGFAWLFGEARIARHIPAQLSAQISEYILRAVPIIDYMVAVARLLVGVGTTSDYEVAETFFDSIKSKLKIHGIVVDRHREIFYKSAFLALLGNAREAFEDAMQVLMEHAGRYRVEAFKAITWKPKK